MGRQKGYTPDDYRRAAEQGMSKAEAAKHLGVTKQCVGFMERAHEDIVFKRGKPGPKASTTEGE
jgi:DNA-binding XRE family transcriptional regulator